MDRIKLNVGGHRYETTLSTLTAKDSMLARMFSQDNMKMLKADSDRSYFIDRNGEIFSYILDYLRDDNIPEDKALKARLLKEAEYFCLLSLINLLTHSNPYRAKFMDTVRGHSGIMNIINGILADVDVYTTKGYNVIKWFSIPDNDFVMNVCANYLISNNENFSHDHPYIIFKYSSPVRIVVSIQIPLRDLSSLRSLN